MQNLFRLVGIGIFGVVLSACSPQTATTTVQSPSTITQTDSTTFASTQIAVEMAAATLVAITEAPTEATAATSAPVSPTLEDTETVVTVTADEPPTIPSSTEAPVENAARFAWPVNLASDYKLNPDSSLSDQEFVLNFDNTTNPQDYITIRSKPDAGEAYHPSCQETVTVRGASGASCTTGAGFAVHWVEQGWRYSISGGFMSVERAIALAETLEFIDSATVQERLKQ